MRRDVSFCAVGICNLLLDASDLVIFLCPLINYSFNDLFELLLVILSNLNTVLNQLINVVLLVGIELKRLFHDFLEAIVVLFEDLLG